MPDETRERDQTKRAKPLRGISNSGLLAPQPGTRRVNVVSAAKLGFGVLAGAIALGLAILVMPVSSDYAPLTLLLLLVVIAGWYLGVSAGIAAMVVGAAGFYYFFEARHGAIKPSNPDIALDLATFILAPTIIMVLTSRLKSALQEAKIARRDLQLALQMRDDFLAQVSHDLRSPLSVVKLRAQMLLRNNASLQMPSPKLEQGLREIVSVAESMAAMIHELVQSTRLDAARMKLGETLQLVRAPTELVGLVKRMVAQQEALDGQHGFRVTAEMDELVGDWDAQEIQRAVQNLLENAVKYSPPGTDIHVTLSGREESSQRWAILQVHDQGLGVPVAEQPHIFERSRRGSNVGKVSGTGLGLFSAKHIVERHGGTIGVQSAEGSGSTFVIQLPLVRSAAAQDPMAWRSP